MTPEEFSKFRHDAVHELMSLNEACERKFKISTLHRWDYDLDDGTLTFSQDGVARVVALIQIVGTTSETDGTWLWSWANQSLPGKVTRAIGDVRAFGERESLSELTTPSLTDDEYLGWAMTAITARVLGSKGAYRCPRHDNGFLYLVYVDLGFAVTVGGSTVAKQVKCGTHDVGYATFICEHLMSKPGQEWFSDDPTEGNQWPDAWCAACQDLFQKQGEWNDKNSSGRHIRALCHHCYESLRSQSRARRE
jgi:hypothetical protein